jgi:hypothetical protein
MFRWQVKIYRMSPLPGAVARVSPGNEPWFIVRVAPSGRQEKERIFLSAAASGTSSRLQVQ